MTEWSVINSEEELDPWDREEYAFRIGCKEAWARAEAKAEADWQRHYGDALARVEEEVKRRRGRR